MLLFSPLLLWLWRGQQVIWCLTGAFSLSLRRMTADDSQGCYFFAKFPLESRTEANTFSWGGNPSADRNQEASPPLGLYTQPAPTRTVAIRFTGKARPFTFTGNTPEGRHSRVFPKHLFSFPSYSLLLDRTGVNTFYLTDAECYNPDSTRVRAVTTFNFRRFGWSLYFSVNISYNPLSQKFAPWEELTSFCCWELELDDKGCFSSNLGIESLSRHCSNV